MVQAIPQHAPRAATQLSALGAWTLCGHKNLSRCLFTGNLVEAIQGSLLIMERSSKDIATKY